jgi:hypothetical protein
MRDQSQLKALQWALDQLLQMDHDCHRSPNDGCDFCDCMDALIDTIQRKLKGANNECTCGNATLN